MSRILIVEDDPAVLRGLRDNLVFEAYDVLTATDAERAYQLIHAERPDLVLLDLMLPGMWGGELCRRLRAEGLTTPIVMLTAKTGESDRVEALDLGCNDYVSKPFGVRELCARIRSILRHRRDVTGEHGRLVDELRSAAKVQRSLLPDTRPALRTLDCAGVCVPASAVGGDYFDYIPLGGGRLVLMLADVAGKGMPAALLMASVHGMTRAQVMDDASPARLVQRLNGLLHARGERPSYVTLFCAEYDDGTRRLEYVNAGHPPPLLIGGGQVRALDATCPPVGLFERIEAAPVTIELHDAERLVMYTDGVTEATSAIGEEFGRDRLACLLDDLGPAGAPRLCTAVVDAVVAHQAGANQRDDVTVLAAQVGGRS